MKKAIRLCVFGIHWLMHWTSISISDSPDWEYSMFVHIYESAHGRTDEGFEITDPSGMARVINFLNSMEVRKPCLLFPGNSGTCKAEIEITRHIYTHVSLIASPNGNGGRVGLSPWGYDGRLISYSSKDYQQLKSLIEELRMDKEQ